MGLLALSDTTNEIYMIYHKLIYFDGGNVSLTDIIIKLYILNMDNTQIAYPDTNCNSIAFKFENNTNKTQTIYMKNITAFTHLQNIDYATNCFTWLERRYPDEYSSYYIPSFTIEDIMDDPPPVYVLCCAFIPAALYQTVVDIITNINSAISPDNTNRILGSIEIAPVGGAVYSMYSLTFKPRIDEGINGIDKYIIPCVVDIPVLSNNFILNDNKKLYNINRDTSILPPGILLEYDDNDVLVNARFPDDPPGQYSSYAFQNSVNTISKNYHANNLMSHGINFTHGITNKLHITNLLHLPLEALFTDLNSAVECYNNGSNYCEFILNPVYIMNNINLTQYRNVFSYIMDRPPVFPISNKLYVRICNSQYIDKYIETTSIDQRILLPALAEVDINATYTLKTIPLNENGTITLTDLSLNVDASFITIDLNKTFVLHPNDSFYIYIIGNNQLYPLQQEQHKLLYSIT